VATLADGLGGPWQRPRYRREAVHIALVGLHACRRDEHYLVRDGRIDLLDEVTGRVAVGRFWSRGLHTVVALKEGLAAPPETETVAQTTFQRFFQRYWRLGGISGTLWEARAELHEVYGARVVRIPLYRPCIRQMLPARCFDSTETMFDAVAERVAMLQAAGRPVLVGTDSVADSAHLSALLHARGVRHQLLNAVQDADEAQRIASAGVAGRVTVATNIAGRGTDIRLDAAAATAGGLHVIATMRNRSRRIDRQLIGRAARHGDPGSAESLLALDDALLTALWPAALRRAVAAFAGEGGRVPAVLARPLFAFAQRLCEWRDQRRRRELRHADQRATEAYAALGRFLVDEYLPGRAPDHTTSEGNVF